VILFLAALDNDVLANSPSGFCARNLPIDLQHDPAIDDRFVFLVQRIGGGEQKFLFCPVAEVIAAREAALHIVAI